MNPRTCAKLAIVFGLGAIFGVLLGHLATMPLLTPVGIARKDIPAGTIIEHPEEWLESRPCWRWMAKDTTTGNLPDLRNKITLRPLAKDQLCAESDFGTSPLAVMQVEIPPGHRAMTVRVALLLPVKQEDLLGERIDLIVKCQDTSNSLIQSEKVYLQDLLVIGTGWTYAPGDVFFPIFTLAVLPEEAEKLAWVATASPPVLLVRKRGDRTVSQTLGAHNPLDPLGKCR